MEKLGNFSRSQLSSGQKWGLVQVYSLLFSSYNIYISSTIYPFVSIQVFSDDLEVSLPVYTVLSASPPGLLPFITYY